MMLMKRRRWWWRRRRRRRRSGSRKNERKNVMCEICVFTHLYVSLRYTHTHTQFVRPCMCQCVRMRTHCSWVCACVCAHCSYVPFDGGGKSIRVAWSSLLQEYPVEVNLSIRYCFYSTYNQEMRCRFIQNERKAHLSRSIDKVAFYWLRAAHLRLLLLLSSPLFISIFIFMFLFPNLSSMCVCVCLFHSFPLRFSTKWYSLLSYWLP